MNPDAQLIVDTLGLIRHPEGGYYRETYRSKELIPAEALPERFREGARSFSTAIYFLLSDGEFSALHRIQSDEIWHHYAGGILILHVLDGDGRYIRHELGRGLAFQVAVKAGMWFGASLEDPDSFALVGCTVAPGFDFRDFEMADREILRCLYPGQEEVIRNLTR